MIDTVTRPLSLTGHTPGLVTRAEEKNATKNGLKLLKRVGATKEELKGYKKDLNEAGKTYKNVLKEFRYDNLRKKIRLKNPSKRHSEF